MKRCWTPLLVVIGLAGYPYVGYPLILWMLARRSGAKQPVEIPVDWPRITVGVPAYNEERTIARRIENLLCQNYPPDRLEIIVASDGSTDQTASVVAGYADKGVRLLVLPRRGKAATDNSIIGAATSDIVVTTSAAGTFERDALRNLARHFVYPQIGCVVGVFRSRDAHTSSEYAEGTYWRFENAIRGLESRLGILSVSPGLCLAFRRRLYRPIPTSGDVDNLVPLMVRRQGYGVVLEPEAIAYDEMPSSHALQFRQRARMTTRGLRDLFRVPDMLNPIAFPGPAFSLWSHKIGRWMSPIWILSALPLSLICRRHPIGRVALAGQLVGYSAAAAGALGVRSGVCGKACVLAHNFVVANVGVLLGLANLARRKQVSIWTPTEE